MGGRVRGPVRLSSFLSLSLGRSGLCSACLLHCPSSLQASAGEPSVSFSFNSLCRLFLSSQFVSVNVRCLPGGEKVFFD